MCLMQAAWSYLSILCARGMIDKVKHDSLTVYERNHVTDWVCYRIHVPVSFVVGLFAGCSSGQ